jgi:hypothetical protein
MINSIDSFRGFTKLDFGGIAQPEVYGFPPIYLLIPVAIVLFCIGLYYYGKEDETKPSEQPRVSSEDIPIKDTTKSPFCPYCGEKRDTLDGIYCEKCGKALSKT